MFSCIEKSQQNVQPMYLTCRSALIGYSTIRRWIEKLGFVGDVFPGTTRCWGVHNHHISCVNWAIVVVSVDKEWSRAFIMPTNGKVIKTYQWREEVCFRANYYILLHFKIAPRWPSFLQDMFMFILTLPGISLHVDINFTRNKITRLSLPYQERNNM